MFSESLVPHSLLGSVGAMINTNGILLHTGEIMHDFCSLADQSFITGHLHGAGWLGKLITKLFYCGTVLFLLTHHVKLV